MNWINLTFIVLGSYFLYYTINILLDVAKSKKVKTAGDNTIIQFEEEEEPTVVKNDFLETEKNGSLNEFEEEQPVTVTVTVPPIEEKEEKKESQEAQALDETKKKESKEEENTHEKESEEKDTQDIKFQSMPVSEFLANAKKFSSQIDFS